MELKKVLIVEDEAIVARDIQMCLEDMGYEITGIAASGDRALAILENTPTDLVLMDINLKGSIDGVSTAELVRDKYDLPVVYLTAYADGPTFERAKLTDPFGYILKPFEERLLQISIEVAFHKYKSERRIKAREKWIESVLNCINSAVIATDSHGTITYINPRAEQILETSRDESLAQPVATFLQLEDDLGAPMSRHPIEFVLRKGTPQIYDQIRVRAPEKPTKTIQLTLNGLRDHSGHLVGAVLGFQDISKRRESEKNLKHVQENLDFKIESASKSIQRKLERAEHQLKLNHQSLKELRKIERKYNRLISGDMGDDE